MRTWLPYSLESAGPAGSGPRLSPPYPSPSCGGCVLQRPGPGGQERSGRAPLPPRGVSASPSPQRAPDHRSQRCFDFSPRLLPGRDLSRHPVVRMLWGQAEPWSMQGSGFWTLCPSSSTQHLSTLETRTPRPVPFSCPVFNSLPATHTLVSDFLLFSASAVIQWRSYW